MANNKSYLRLIVEKCQALPVLAKHHVLHVLLHVLVIRLALVINREHQFLTEHPLLFELVAVIVFRTLHHKYLCEEQQDKLVVIMIAKMQSYLIVCENTLIRMIERNAWSANLEQPFGRSRISRAVMSITDCAVRTAMRAELGAEFFTSPQKYLLGADDDAFDKPKWQAYIGSLFLASKDKDGDVPQFGQLAQGSMQPHMDYMRQLAAQFSGETCVPISSLGVIHDNPASAEAIYAAKEDLIIEAQNFNDDNEAALRGIAVMSMAVPQNKRPDMLTDEELGIMCNFRSPTMPSIVSQSDAMVKQATVAPWIAETDVFLEELGYSEEQRSRMRAEKQKANAKSAIAALIASAPKNDGDQQ